MVMCLPLLYFVKTQERGDGDEDYDGFFGVAYFDLFLL